MCVIFFFQAEDGIRDTSVTGVQTCALPILGTKGALAVINETAAASGPLTRREMVRRLAAGVAWPLVAGSHRIHELLRKDREERRVGKECRCRRLGCD